MASSLHDTWNFLFLSLYLNLSFYLFFFTKHEHTRTHTHIHTDTHLYFFPLFSLRFVLQMTSGKLRFWMRAFPPPTLAFFIGTDSGATKIRYPPFIFSTFFSFCFHSPSGTLPPLLSSRLHSLNQSHILSKASLLMKFRSGTFFYSCVSAKEVLFPFSLFPSLLTTPCTRRQVICYRLCQILPLFLSSSSSSLFSTQRTFYFIFMFLIFVYVYICTIRIALKRRTLAWRSFK